jgi:hypothetical protein
MNVQLCAPFTDWEIEKGTFHWDLLKDSVCATIRKFLEGGDMPEVVNSTVLVLIPKVKQPQDLTQYRPIALCNVLYKIASKVLSL